MNAIQDRVQDNFGAVEIEAGRMLRRLGPNMGSFVGRDDLISWGSLGLLEAARRYDPDRGVPFEHYARHRVRGAMFDGLRESHETPQRLWRARKTNDAGSAAVLEHHAERVAGARSAGWLADAGSDDFGEPMAVAREPNPEAIASDNQLADVIEAAVEDLPEAEGELIRQHVLEDTPLADVACSLGVSIPRANQLRARALRRLAPRLRGLTQPEAGLSRLA